jgi:hypothetical protein
MINEGTPAPGFLELRKIETCVQFTKPGLGLLIADATMRAYCFRRNSMSKHSPASSIFYSCCFVTVLLTCALVVAAQSGRRVRKSESAPVPIPTPEVTPTPTAMAERPRPAFTFIVGLDRYSDFSTISLNVYSGVLRSCVDRLDDSASVVAEMSTNDMSRGDAIRKAKAEKEGYVVWLHLRSNNFNDQGRSQTDSRSVYIEYSVFAPVTGKLATSGNTYPEAYRNRGIRLPTSSVNGDYYLNQAARGAAERILDHFHVRVPNTLP